MILKGTSQKKNTNGQEVSLAIKKMQIKTTLRHHQTSHDSYDGYYKKKTRNAGENAEKKEPSYSVGGNVN
jgi:hypothetical protein